MTVTETNLIPETKEAVVAELNTLGTMTTSTEWERSAYVYALASPTGPKGGRPKKTVKNVTVSRVTFTELADWGIVGLTTRQTVAAYWKYWNEAVIQGLALPAELGGAYEQPAKDWPGFPKVPDSDDEPEANTPFDIAANIIAAATKKVLAVIDVDGLDETDIQDLEAPLANGLEAAIADVREDWAGKLSNLSV
jgi:hypothetical protein